MRLFETADDINETLGPTRELSAKPEVDKKFAEANSGKGVYGPENISFYCDTRLDVRDGVLLGVETKFGRVDINSSVETTDTRKLFKHTISRRSDGTVEKITFDDDHAKQYFQTLYNLRLIKIRAEFWRDTETERKLETMDKPGGNTNLLDKFKDMYSLYAYEYSLLLGENRDPFEPSTEEEVNELKSRFRRKIENTSLTAPNVFTVEEGDSFTNAVDETLELFTRIQQTRLPIKKYCSSFAFLGKTYKFQRYLLGKGIALPTQVYEPEHIFVDRVLFGVMKLGTDPNTNIVAFENNLVDVATPTRYSVTSPANPINIFTSTEGSYTNGGIISVNPTSKTFPIVINSPFPFLRPDIHKISMAKNTLNTFAHELGHAIVNDSHGTVAQEEGFVTILENGPDYKKLATMYLLERPKLEGFLTAEYVNDLMSAKPSKIYSNLDIYNSSGSFYAYLATKLNPSEIFIFYKYLTSGYYDDTSKMDASCKGDIARSLAKIPDFELKAGVAPERLVDEYVEDMNARLKELRQMITSLAP